MPKLVFTSDWHAGLTASKKIEAMLQEIAAEKPDALIIAGDHGASLRHSRTVLALARAILPCPIGIVAGNHDLWGHTPEGGDSLALFEYTWPAICRELGLVWLESEVLSIGPIAITGSIGWYDYSRRPPADHPLAQDFTPERLAAVKGAYNNDAHEISWGLSDPEFANLVGDALETRLAGLERDPAVERVVVATHVPAFAEQQVSLPRDSPIADAYFGNYTLGARITRYPKVSHVISGHTHRGVPWQSITRPHLTLRVATVGSNYGNPQFIIGNDHE